MNKYRNKKVLYDGIMFDSIKEKDRWVLLKYLEKTGKIHGLKRQKPFELIPKQNSERAVKYKADATYWENGRFIVEDTKSHITRKKPEYIIKRKLMLWRYGIKILEV